MHIKSFWFLSFNAVLPLPLLRFFMPLYGLLPAGVHGVVIIIRANTSSSLITIMTPLATCHTLPILYALYETT